MTMSGAASAVASAHRSGANATPKVVGSSVEVKSPRPVLVRRGRATRYDTYHDVDRRSDEFGGVSPDAHVTTARVVGLIIRSGEALGVCPGARLVLAAVAERIYDARRWVDTALSVPVSTRRLALEIGLSERQVQRYLATLEAHGWLIRRYSYANHRLVRQGLDLRPLAARLDELVSGATDVDRRIEQSRAEMLAEHDDAYAVAEAMGDGLTADVSTPDDICVGTESTATNPPSVDGVQAQQRSCWRSPRHDLDRELLDLMIERSPTLQHSLGIEDIDDPDPVRIVRAVTYIAEQHGIRRRIAPDLWGRALDRHGLAALAAVLIAVDRPGIHDPASYLAGMLRRPRLRETVIHSLRLIDRPTPVGKGNS